jgi:lysyl-tRNA synthetase class 2
MFAIMDDIDRLVAYIKKMLSDAYPDIMSSAMPTPRRMHMRDVWKEFANVDLDTCLERQALFAICVKKGYGVEANESYEDLFYRIFLNEIEPKLVEPIIIHHYPKAMAALAKIDPNDPGYAERFELYAKGIELANAFSELTDMEEQRQRFEAEQENRNQNNMVVYSIDEDFLDALQEIPSAAGIALGVDRLVQLYAGCKDIDDVIPLPASKLFNP